MLRDRRVLIETEIRNLTEECGAMYLAMVTQSDPAGIVRKVYESKLSRLANMKTELEIIVTMINNGHP